ncbi:hypothetical protein [Staphylococcus phage LY01]|nr:hypothetical protein [Staphylococcus phage LY01]
MKTYGLKESELYRQLNLDVNRFTKQIKSEHLMGQDQLADTFSIIKNRINQASKNEVVDKLENGDILLLNSKEVKLPNFMPVLNIQGNKALVNITPYIKSNMNINPNTLFGLAQAGLINIKVKKDSNKIRNNAKLLIYSSQIYSRLATKVMDKLYATNINKKDSDLISYMFAKFFLVSIIGRTNDDSTEQIAYKSCHNRTDFDVIKDMESKFDGQSSMLNLFSLFKEFKKHPNFNKFSSRSFIENFTKMYGETSILAIDHLPSFFTMIFSAYVNAGINKEFIILNAINDKIIINCYRSFF